jgi:predicted transcriptional regulator
MPVVKTDSVFSGIPVSQAMRQQVVSLNRSADIGQGIRMMTRYKVNAVLLTDNGIPCGVLSKRTSWAPCMQSCRKNCHWAT